MHEAAVIGVQSQRATLSALALLTNGKLVWPE